MPYKSKKVRAEKIWNKKHKTQEHCWSIRITMLGGGSIWVVSTTEPILEVDRDDAPTNLHWTPIESPTESDTIGFIRWDQVSSIAWRERNGEK